MYKIWIIVLVCVLSGCAANKKCVDSSTGFFETPTEDIMYTEVEAENLVFNVETGEISYSLPEEALVRIRIGLKNGGPLLHTLVDWEPRAKGAHKELWNKRDDSDKVDFGNLDYLVAISCIMPTQKKSEQLNKRLGFHKAPSFKIEFPENIGIKNNEAYPLSKNEPIRVVISKEDNKWLTEKKYEVSVFVDNVFLIEDEEGVNPYSFFLNTKGYQDGEHLLTINVICYEGEVGSRSIRFLVKK